MKTLVYFFGGFRWDFRPNPWLYCKA